MRIWGFDLSEMSWGAFAHKRMFERGWHLRRERIIAYQLAMNLCLAAECTATYSLSKYNDLQTNVEQTNGHLPHLHNNDIIAAEVLTIVFCVFVATLFGADMFFLLQFPRRTYPKWYNSSRKGLAVGITMGVLAAALMSTIVVARKSAFITGVDEATKQELVQFFYRPPLKYNQWPTNIAYIVLLWLGWLCTLASTIFMFMSVQHDERFGVNQDQRFSNVPSNASVVGDGPHHDKEANKEAGVTH